MDQTPSVFYCVITLLGRYHWASPGRSLKPSQNVCVVWLPAAVLRKIFKCVQMLGGSTAVVRDGSKTRMRIVREAGTAYHLQH